jgi:DNA-binding MurR/RpiR family transcriptional regulator
MTVPPAMGRSGRVPWWDDPAGASVLVRLRALLPTFPLAERRVAEAVLDDPAGAAAMTINALARAGDTSVATVQRFCRALGFDGYPGLRLALAAEAGRALREDGQREVSGDIRPGEDLATIVEKIAFADARAVEDTARHLDLDVVGAAVDALARARRIDLYGVGASAFVALDFQQKLHRIGRVAFAWPDPHIALTSAALLSAKDVAVGVSHTGTTRDTVEALEEAKRQGATTIALTNFPRSPLATVADLVVVTAARETTFRSGAMASRLAQLTVVDVLFVAVAARSFARTQRALQRTRQAVAIRRLPGDGTGGMDQ